MMSQLPHVTGPLLWGYYNPWGFLQIFKAEFNDCYVFQLEEKPIILKFPLEYKIEKKE